MCDSCNTSVTRFKIQLNNVTNFTLHCLTVMKTKHVITSASSFWDERERLGNKTKLGRFFFLYEVLMNGFSPPLLEGFFFCGVFFCCLSFFLLFFNVEWLCELTVLEIACGCVEMDGLIQLDASMDSMIVCVSIFSSSFSVRMYYCTAHGTVFHWICALQVFIIIIIY